MTFMNGSELFVFHLNDWPFFHAWWSMVDKSPERTSWNSFIIWVWLNHLPFHQTWFPSTAASSLAFLLWHQLFYSIALIILSPFFAHVFLSEDTKNGVWCSEEVWLINWHNDIFKAVSAILPPPPPSSSLPSNSVLAYLTDKECLVGVLIEQSPVFPAWLQLIYNQAKCLRRRADFFP